MKSEIKLFSLLCLLFFLTITTRAQEVIATSGGDGNQHTGTGSSKF
jgi:hypothetical protein